MVSEEQAQQAPQQQPKSKKKTREQAQVEALKPHPSPWPVALAFSLCILLVGFITYPVLLGIGIVLTIICVVAWGVERR
jgi:hypothetical protein